MSTDLAFLYLFRMFYGYENVLAGVGSMNIELFGSLEHLVEGCLHHLGYHEGIESDAGPFWAIKIVATKGALL